MMQYKAKAVALISGGLDSMLAVKLIQEQGIEVEGLNFYTGFCHSGHTSAIRNQRGNKPLRNDALWVAEQLGIKLHIEDVVEPYKEVLINPKHGYGKNINPCLDCKIFMVNRALEWMEKNQFDFIITGEVVGQRPKSQNRRTMPIIAKQSGAHDRLLRPLSAHLLPPTLPEREGWVDRDRLLGLSGRNRNPQFDLAASWGIDEFSQPAGGCCVLTDENYTRRLKDFWQHKENRDYQLEDIILLKAGRHLRPAANFKIIIARDEAEHHFLSGYRQQFIHLELLHYRGPLVLVDGQPSEADLNLAARVGARFCTGRDEEAVSFIIHAPQASAKTITVRPLPAGEIPQSWYL